MISKRLSETTSEIVEDYLAVHIGVEPKNVYREVIDEVEKPLLKAVMNFSCGNQSEAAKYLGINRATLRTKLKRHLLL